eukprot:2318976-Prorocentrum_lima.AAC.1
MDPAGLTMPPLPPLSTPPRMPQEQVPMYQAIWDKRVSWRNQWMGSRSKAAIMWSKITKWRGFSEGEKD